MARSPEPSSPHLTLQVSIRAGAKCRGGTGTSMEPLSFPLIRGMSSGNQPWLSCCCLASAKASLESPVQFNHPDPAGMASGGRPGKGSSHSWEQNSELEMAGDPKRKPRQELATLTANPRRSGGSPSLPANLFVEGPRRDTGKRDLPHWLPWPHCLRYHEGLNREYRGLGVPSFYTVSKISRADKRSLDLLAWHESPLSSSGNGCLS